ncbi:hypothetical protein AVEN_249489-1 [Araneus ventricosus]|uniref:Uncharacterized protein n=1 Tax=Araneus ventricosus TaxID=182803 RepID=A0A4Y2KQN8_ARAVE|nr:hypothetical protein AVEN_249489-1 [Araneus ventricosus]
MELQTVTGTPFCACTRNVSLEAHGPHSLRLSVWFQHDRAPPHITPMTSTNNQTLHLDSIGLIVVVQFIGWIAGSIMPELLLLGSNEDIVVRDTLSR